MQQLEIEFSTWGGARDGAGRKRRPGVRASVAHRPRERHARAHPVHVTLRARRGLPPFREKVLGGVVREAIRAANHVSALSPVFRVLHFSVQVDHVHLVVEAADRAALARGVQGLAIRIARRINGTLGVRGRVWEDRFHSRELATPRAVRNAIVYVLMNAKKHGMRTRAGLDPFSSAPWFDGFVRSAPLASSPVRSPSTWLASNGWRRRGLVRFDERPRAPD
ncbi:MAG TPA: transposase [Polyangiaceae bacterium]|jgi:REP element-mobilizing transposase RayT